MRKNKLLIPGMIFLVLTVYSACRKIDYAEKKENKDIGSRFFSAYPTFDKSVLAVQGFMKRQEIKYAFVDKMVERIGLPRWDKAMMFLDGNGQIYQRSATGDSATVVFLPFVRPGEAFVNTLMTFRMTEVDTSWRGLCDWQYDELSPETAFIDTTQWNVRDGFNVFSTLDRVVFGYHEFEVTDGRIFGKNKTDTLWVTLDTLTGTNGRNSSTQRSASNYFSYLCRTFTICEPVSGNSRPNVLGVNCYTSNWCTIIFPGGNNGGWWPWEQGGGGVGGGGGYIPPAPPPCPPPVVQRGMTEGPGCRPRGWRPFTNGGGGIPPPNDSTIAVRLKRLMEKSMLQINIDSLHNIAQQDGDERTFTFNRNPNGDTAVIYPHRGNSHSSQPKIFFTSFGFFHTHQEDDPAGGTDKNQCFDSPDIYKLYKNAVVDRYPLTVSIISTREYFYAIVITDFNKFKSHIESLANSRNIYVIQDKIDSLHVTAWNNCTPAPCTWQRGSELGSLAISANNDSNVSGIKIFRSPRQSISFTVLNP